MKKFLEIWDGGIALVAKYPEYVLGALLVLILAVVVL